jgi:hypothetical protein
MGQLNLVSARSAQQFAVTVKVGKTVSDIWTGAEIGQLPAEDFMGDFCPKDGLCTEDEIVEFLKTSAILCGDMEWSSSYVPFCDDYRQVTFVAKDKSLAYEFTICTADGILANDELCQAAWDKECRKNGYSHGY